MNALDRVITAFALRENRRPRVLLVEDDATLGRMLAWGFQELGAQANLASTCAAARRFAARETADLMVLDADLPDGDGITLAASLAREQPEAFIAICSGRHGLPHCPAGTPAVDAVLTKPVPEHRLRALLQDALSAILSPERH